MSAVIRALLLACLLGLSAAPVAASDSVVIYRCTGADGAVSVQNDVPCPKGSQQQRRVIETARPSAPVSSPPASAPLAALVSMPIDPGESMDGAAEPTAADPSAVPEPDAPDSPPADPPPPLFSCRTWDRKEHFSDDPVPTRRCAPLRVSGLDGSDGGGQAAACEYVTDTCTPVPEEALCKQWHQYAHDTRAMLLFGRAEDPAATRVDLDRIEALVQASTCRGEE